MTWSTDRGPGPGRQRPQFHTVQQPLDRRARFNILITCKHCDMAHGYAVLVNVFLCSVNGSRPARVQDCCYKSWRSGLHLGGGWVGGAAPCWTQVLRGQPVCKVWDADVWSHRFQRHVLPHSFTGTEVCTSNYWSATLHKLWFCCWNCGGSVIRPMHGSSGRNSDHGCSKQFWNAGDITRCKVPEDSHLHTRSS
jgi:hypothetical protein